LATNDHSSSSWTSRVSGGKGHELVVGVPGVLPGLACQSHDGVAVDADESLGLADPVALDEVLEDGDGRLGGQVRVEQRGALALGEAGLAGVAVEQADPAAFAVMIADREVAAAALAVERAIGVLAAEAREIVHGRRPTERGTGSGLIDRNSQDNSELGLPQ
jgi:hypothetical protein